MVLVSEFVSGFFIARIIKFRDKQIIFFPASQDLGTAEPTVAWLSNCANRYEAHRVDPEVNLSHVPIRK